MEAMAQGYDLLLEKPMAQTEQERLNLLKAVDAHDEALLSSSLAASVESHVMGFACERSRSEALKVEGIKVEG